MTSTDFGMGSCENLAIIEKPPLCGSLIEQNSEGPSVSEHWSCLEPAYGLSESNMDLTNAPEGSQRLSRVGHTSCVSTGDLTGATQVFAMKHNGLVGENQNTDDLALEKVPDTEQDLSLVDDTNARTGEITGATEASAINHDGLVSESQNMSDLALGSEQDFSLVDVTYFVSTGEVTEAEEVFAIKHDMLAGESRDVGDLAPETVRGSAQDLSWVIDTICVSTGQVVEAIEHNGLVGETQNVGDLVLEKVPAIEQNLSQINDCGCVNASEVTETTEVFTITNEGLVGEVQNMGDLALEEVSDSEYKVTGDCSKEMLKQGAICNLETGALCLEKGVFQGEDDCETPLLSMPMNGSRGNCLQLDEMDDKSLSCSPSGGIMVVMSEKTSLERLETDIDSLISPSHGCEMPLELIPLVGLSSNCAQLNERGETSSIHGLSSEDMDGKIDDSEGTETDVSNQISPLQGGEMHLEPVHVGDIVSNGKWRGDQKDENTASCLSAEHVTGISPSETDACIQPLSSPRRNDKSVDDPCAESVAKVVEEKSDLSTVISDESCTYMLLVEENSCNLKETAATIAHHYDLEQSVFLPSSQPFSSASPDTLKDTPDQDFFASTNSSSGVGFSVHSDEGKDNGRFGCHFETKCPEIVSASTRRNGRRSKSRQKTTKKSGPKKGKNKTSVPHPRECIGIFVKVVRMKRSCVSKPARSSSWGLLGNITQFFKVSNGLDGISQLHNQRSRKARSGRRSGKQNKKSASGRSKDSRGNHFAPTSCIRLKVKVGNVSGQYLNNMAPEVLDMSASASATIGGNGTEFYSGTDLELPKLTNGIGDKLREDESMMQLECFGEHHEKAKTCSDAFIMDMQLRNNDLEITKNVDKVAGDTDDCLGVSSNVVVESLEGTNENRCTDPGTSPDSEVINLIPDARVTGSHQADFHDAVLTSSKDIPAKGRRTGSKKQKKNRVPRSHNHILEDGSSVPVSRNKAKTSKKRVSRKGLGDGLGTGEILTSATSANGSSNLLSNKEVHGEPLAFSTECESGEFAKALKEEGEVEAQTPCNIALGADLSETHNSKTLQSSTKGVGFKVPKSVRVSKGRSKASETVSRRGNARRQKEKQGKSVNKCKVKGKGACDRTVHKVESHPETCNSLLKEGSQKLDGIEKAIVAKGITMTNKSNLEMVLGGMEEQRLSVRKAWVLCDDCHKWRRIPALLADSIEKTNCTWTCKDNTDKAFSDCSIPQEKSNAEINAELDISDASGEEDAYDGRLNYKGLECKRSAAYQESTFKCISHNEFLHRRRKSQTIDEIMVCHCKSPVKSQSGCGDECLNRMLNIECVQGTCPCGDLCSNQQFQKQKYAKLQWFRSGKKGYGLKLLEDIPKGQFLIEYVGEVLDMQAYEARQREYALNGHRHFYFMTLNGSEVIDACAKGNLGRFINHSCDPNCRTEKWMVNGEICIGLFALRDIKQGEEVTFDYNYVRVFGAAAKKCYCGAPQCRGFIGGDPLNSDVIVQGDSDDEFPEPVMLVENGESEGGLDNMMPKATHFDRAEIQTASGLINHRHGVKKATTAVGQLKSTIENDSLNQSSVSQLQSPMELQDSREKSPSSIQPFEISHPTEDVTSIPMPAVQQENSTEEGNMNKTSSDVDRSERFSPIMALSKALSDVDANMGSKSDTVEDKWVSAKSNSLWKVSRSSSSVKRGKVSSSPLNSSKVQAITNKSQSLSIKPKKLLDSSSNGGSEAVEEKLNELLDTDGGISKRKDAPKGYLKLLLLTAASGDSGNGEAIQSNRDLSMILDALLKTKSRAVLNDIINKNGLRMLHNIMKQYRRDFKKIPILRKLLKVLEYLAVREILTSEHINGGPPCPGMESFRESILSLTEHDDKKVHQIARNFRDRWIPRPVRKLGYSDRDDGRMEIRRGSNCNRFSASQNHWREHDPRPTEAIDCVKQSVVSTTSYDNGLQEGSSPPCVGGCQGNKTRTRKRKSRWDQPAEISSGPKSPQHKELKTESPLPDQFESRLSPGDVNVTVDLEDSVSRKNGCYPGSIHSHCQQDEASGADTERQNVPEDVPPGFSTPQVLVSSCASSTATDLPQQNVCHRKHAFDVVVGQPQEKFISRLPVSYGIPLPIIEQFGTPQAESGEGWVVAPGMPFHPFPPLPPFPRDKKDQPPSAINHLTNNPPAEGQRESHCPAPCYVDETVKCSNTPCANSQQSFKRPRESSHDLGRRYFRQEKRKLGPPWLRKRQGWGYMGDNLRGSSCSVGIGNVANELTNSYLSQDVSSRVEKAGTSFYQHSQHQNHH